MSQWPKCSVKRKRSTDDCDKEAGYSLMSKRLGFYGEGERKTATATCSYCRPGGIRGVKGKTALTWGNYTGSNIRRH